MLETIVDLFLVEGLPEYIRSDNGSEFVAKMVQDFLSKIKVKKHILRREARGKVVLPKEAITASNEPIGTHKSIARRAFD